MQNFEFLVIATTTEIVRIREKDILSITSDGNYSHINTIGGEDFQVWLQLGELEKYIKNQLPSTGVFLKRVGRKLIVNMRYLYYVNTSKKKIFLMDMKGKKTVHKASKESLVELKKSIEAELIKTVKEKTTELTI